MSNVFQGLLLSRSDNIKDGESAAKLWIHEAERIYGDRLANLKDLEEFKAVQQSVFAENFSAFDLKGYFSPESSERLVFASMNQEAGAQDYK